MNSEETKREFAENMLPGNPIDEMVQEALEFTRSILFLGARHDVGEEGMFGEFQGFRLERIDAMRQVLKDASSEELEMFKNTSVIIGNGTYDELNKLLYGISQMIPTIYSESNPEYPSRLDNVIFKDNPEGKARKELMDALMSVDTDKIIDETHRNNVISNVGELLGRPLTENDLGYIDSVAKHIEERTYSKNSLLKERLEHAKRLF